MYSRTCLCAQTFELGPRDCQDVVSAMRRDVSMLRTEGLMDYSLLVGIVTKKKGEAAPEGGVANQPYVIKTATHCQYIYVGIIDFLQVNRHPPTISLPLSPQLLIDTTT